METLGSLVDKLVTANVKMWHNQEDLYAIRKMTPEEFTRKYENRMTELHVLIAKCCDLNVHRAALVDEIDQLFADVVAGRRVAEVRPQHKTY